MEIAKVKVTGTRAYATEALDIPQGIVGATVSFDFGPEWAGLTKNVVFVGVTDKEILNIQDSVYLPPEVVSAPNIIVKVGVVGVDANKKMAIPTLWADLGAVKPATPVDMGYDPTLPIWAQLLGMIGDLRNLNTEDKSSLVAAVNEAMQNGGGAGGYYTPVVTQPTANTMQISFVPSVATMPDVKPVTITLPGSNSGQNPTGGGGWTTEQIDLLDSLLSNISFNSENGGAIADMLIASLRSGASSGGGSGDSGGDSGGETEPDNPTVETYTITRYLTGCTSSSSISSVVGGTEHSETLTPADGYTFDGATVSVTMGGEDITDNAYSDGVLNIASVTGNIAIIAVAVNIDAPIYEISEPITYDGTEATSVDTGIAIWETERDWSIVADVVNNGGNVDYSVFVVSNPENRYGNPMLRLAATANNPIKVYVNGTAKSLGNAIWFSEKPGNTAKVIMTHTADSGKVVVAYRETNIAGKTDAGEGMEVVPSDVWVNSESSLVIGSTINGSIASSGFTLNDFKIYKRALTADEISAYLA